MARQNSWPLQRDCNKFYGNPRGSNGQASAAWESANLTLVKCPFVLRYDGKPVKGLRVHKKCAESLARVLNAIWERFGRSQAEIDRVRMSVYGGAYNFRLMRNGRSLSMHAWGCAIDIDPARNGLGNSKPAMDLRIVEEFEREGWEWGGHWKDGMHFQAAWTRASPPRLKKKPESSPMGLMSGPEEAEPNEPPAEPEPTTPPASVGAEVHGDPELFSVQKRLKAMNYSPGLLDGLWGSNTSGAINGFINDRESDIAAPTSREAFVGILGELKAEIGEAESESPPFKRPVSESRASGDAKVVAAVAPEVVPVRRNFLVSAWGAVATFFAAAWQVVGDAVKSMWAFFTDHKDDLPSDSGILSTAWGYVTSVPALVWIVLAGAGLVFIALNSRNSENKIKESVTTGARQ